MLSLCETTTCRRLHLLSYFGEAADATSCGNCDVCLNPPQVWDATVEVQKAFVLCLSNWAKFWSWAFDRCLRGI